MPKAEPIEIRFIKQTGKKSINNYFIEYLKSRVHNKEFTLLRAYGWYDFMLIIKNPLSANSSVTLNGLDEQIEEFDCLESSFLVWILEDSGENSTENDYFNPDSIPKRIRIYVRDILKKLNP